jgi:hypothetical protein
MNRIVKTLLCASVLAAPAALLAEDPGVMATIDRNDKAQNEKNWYSPNFTYWDVSVNYLDWSSDTEKRAEGKTNFSDFVYLELEGGGGWDWGEFYFFTDIENPGKSWDNVPTDDLRFVIKPILDIKLGESDFYFHLQDYLLKSKTFFVNNLVPGIAYKFSMGKFWIRPFIGPHYQRSTFYDGLNGYMAGWTMIYDFKIGDQKFTLSQWHEYEFKRDKEHYQLEDGTPVGDGRDSGTNGALAIWWHPIKEITAGLQYRYAIYKLGLNDNANAAIFSLKYNF